MIFLSVPIADSQKEKCGDNICDLILRRYGEIILFFILFHFVSRYLALVHHYICLICMIRTNYEMSLIVRYDLN